MTARHPLSPTPRSLLISLVLVVLVASSVPVLANNMGDCSSICHRTGMLGRFAGCRCSLTLFAKRAAYGSDRLFPDPMRTDRSEQANEAAEMAYTEDESTEDTVLPIDDSGFLILPKANLMLTPEQEHLQQQQRYQPLLAASNLAHLLALKRSNLEQHQQLLQQQQQQARQQQLQEQHLQKRLQLRLTESPRLSRRPVAHEDV